MSTGGPAARRPGLRSDRARPCGVQLHLRGRTDSWRRTDPRGPGSAGSDWIRLRYLTDQKGMIGARACAAPWEREETVEAGGLSLEGTRASSTGSLRASRISPIYTLEQSGRPELSTRARGPLCSEWRVVYSRSGRGRRDPRTDRLARSSPPAIPEATTSAPMDSSSVLIALRHHRNGAPSRE